MEHPGVLDRVILDPDTDRLLLIMIETRPWEHGDRQRFQIQEKINSYLSFALDGELAEAYPHLAHKAISLQLDCFAYPDDQTIDFLDGIQQQLSKQGIEFTLRVLEKGS